jgi:NitT/TauT family transport system substrate-binding protein
VIRSRVLLPIAVAAAAATLTACTGEASSAAGEDDVVRVATQRQPHLFAPYVYAEHAPDGVTIEVVPMANSTDELNAVLTGDVDFALLGVPTVVSGVSQGKDVRLVASGADGGSGLIGSTDIASVEDLDGARIGIVPGSSQEIALRLTLEAAGLDPEADVELVSLGYADMADALSRGDIDAFAGAEVNVSLARLDGAHEIASIYDTPVGPVNIGLATTATLAEEDPELVQQIVDTHTAATAALAADPSAWMDGVTEQLSFDPEVLDLAAENIWLRSDLGGEYLDQVAALAGEMQELAVIDQAPDVGDVVATGFAPQDDR